MSTEKERARSRPYRQRARAESQAQTRERITAAIVELHEQVGPAKTTISDVADRAGVGRMTVYKHFPTEAELYHACSAHWLERNPPPEFSDCAGIGDHRERAREMLGRLYAYYRHSHPMLCKIQRDAPLIPALQEAVGRGWSPFVSGLEEAIVSGVPASKRGRVLAAARVVLDLQTWSTLTQAGLGDRAAAALATDMYAAALR